jgi:profilin
MLTRTPLTAPVVVDEKLTGADKFSSGAILSDSGSPLATSSGFSISSEEGAAIAAIIGGTSAPTVSVGGTSYPVVDADAKREYALVEMLQGVDEVDRVADIHAKSGSSGVIVSTTGKVFIVGVYSEGQNPGSLAPVVKTVVAKLSEKGF